MKHEIESSHDSNYKTSNLQGQMPPELGHLAGLLHFTPLQMLAFEHVVELQLETVESFSRAAILGVLEKNLEWLQRVADEIDNPLCQRARFALDAVKPVFAGTVTLPGQETLSDKPVLAAA